MTAPTTIFGSPSGEPNGTTNRPTIQQMCEKVWTQPAATSVPASQASAPPSSPPGSAARFPSLDLTPLSQRYELLAEAGQGSMGNVYKARDRETGETVALKLLKPEIASDQTMMERFKKEMLFARKITHKNVCRVHEFNRIGGIAYTSMEFVEGESLRSVLNRFGGLPQRKALDLAMQMCSGLQEAHAQGIVHRDLKPENVMIDAQGNVKIMDFGIARSMDAMTRLTGSMVGTPAYMAPEQVAGKEVDYRTDVYALGLILYEVFTGKPTFQADNSVAVALKQMREAPTPPHKIDAAVPFSIERAILKCLEKEPARRFQSIVLLADALRAPATAVPAAPQQMIPTGVAAHATTNHSTHATPFAGHPLYGASAMSVPEPRRKSISGWILLLILLACGAYAALRWDRVLQAEREYAPITVSAAKYYYAQAKAVIWPTPGQSSAQPSTPSAEQDATATDTPAPAEQPDDAPPSPVAAAAAKSFSPRSSVAKPKVESPDQSAAKVPIAPATAADQASEDASQEPSQPTATPKPAGAKSTPAAPALQRSSVRAHAAAASQARSTQANSASPAVERRAEAAFGEGQTLSVPPVNDHAPSYLWIGRFEQEDRAEITAKKVEDLGLPVVVIPRHAERGSFYVVLSGPFGPERVGSVMEWLKEQGFANIRVLKNPLRNGRLIRGVEQDPD